MAIDTAAAAREVQLTFESKLSSWEPRDGGVEFNFMATPAYRRADAFGDLTPRFVLMPGETLTREHGHAQQTLTLVHVSDEQLAFDFTYRQQPESGEVEMAAGRLTLIHGFDPKWRDCASTEECLIIPSWCGGYASVAGRHRVLATAFYGRVGAAKKCSGKTMPRPVASCVEGKCQPNPRFP